VSEDNEQCSKGSPSKINLSGDPNEPYELFSAVEEFMQEDNKYADSLWWRGDENKGKIHWKKWKAVAIPNFVWGWVLEIFSYSNQAMLAKQGVEIDSKS
jgi:hypothetical protein